MYNVHAQWLYYDVLLHDYEYVIAPRGITNVPDYIFVKARQKGWCYYKIEGAREDYLLIKVIEKERFLMKNILEISVLYPATKV